MAQNNEIYDNLSAARIVYQDTFDNELDIIKELKIYLIESGFSSDNNQLLYDFYQYINIPITLEIITNVSINPDPIINNLVQIMFYPNNQNNFINPIINHNNDSDNESDNNHDNESDNTQNASDNHDNESDNNESDDNQDESEPLPEHIEYSLNNNPQNIINILNSLIININNIQENNSVFQNVVVTVDDNDFEKLESQVLTCDHESNCTICMSQMVKNEKITLLKCNHNFHHECITPYLKEYNYKCPICRAEVGKAKYNI